MKIGIREVFGQGRKALLTSAGLSLTLFAYQTHSLTFDDPLLPRRLLLSTLLFLATFLTLRLFAHLVARSLACQSSALATEVAPPGLWIFVVCKELVKCVIGLSLTLAWFAGLLHIGTTFVAMPSVVVLGAGCGYSLSIYLVAYAMVHFIDRLPWSPDW